MTECIFEFANIPRPGVPREQNLTAAGDSFSVLIELFRESLQNKCLK